MQWDEEGWVTAGDAQGTVTASMEVPGIQGTQQTEGIYDVDLATCPQGDPRWCYMRDYEPKRYDFTEDAIRLQGCSVTLEEESIPTFLGIRQNEFETVYGVTLHSEAMEAGVTCYMDESQHYDFALVQDGNGSRVQLKLRTGDAIGIAGELSLPAGTQDAELKVVSDHEQYYFYLVQDGRDVKIGQARTKYLSTEVAGGFTGVLLAMYVIDPQERMVEFSKLTWKQVCKS